MTMDRNTAHESLRASRVDTGARAPVNQRARIMLPDVAALTLRAVLFVVVAVRVDDIAAFLSGVIA